MSERVAALTEAGAGAGDETGAGAGAGDETGAGKPPLVAVVTGANKGLGLAIVRALCERLGARGAVYLAARDEARGDAAAAGLRALGLRPRVAQLDVTSRDSLLRLRDRLRREHGGLDLLVNNAAVVDPELHPSYEACKLTVDTNYRSALTVQRVLFPLLRRGARVLNVSSDCGHLSNVRNPGWRERLARDDLAVEDINAFVEWFLAETRAGSWRREELADGGTLPAYRVAKVALSALSRVQARALAPRGVTVASLHPGLVRTDMTRGVGFLSAGEAARVPARLLLDAPPPRSGGYYWFDGAERDWLDVEADLYFKSATLQPDRSL